MQIDCDFAGDSLIAVGAAKVMGFSLMENFNTPYFAMRIKDFWSGWHISLSTWFRDYLYIPMGGNRKGKVRRYIKLMITFFDKSLYTHGLSQNGFHLLILSETGAKLHDEERGITEREYSKFTIW